MKYFFDYAFVAWFVALIVFGYVEWRVPGFVSNIFPFYLLFLPPGVFLFLSQSIGVNSKEK